MIKADLLHLSFEVPAIDIFSRKFHRFATPFFDRRIKEMPLGYAFEIYALHTSNKLHILFFLKKKNFFMMLHRKNYWFQLHFSQLHPVVADPISVGYEGD
jgi:hypothetical protein